MIDRWAQLAWTQLWQVTLTAAAIGLIVRVCARHRPRLAYLLWMLVVVKCVTPPIWGSPVGLFSRLEVPFTPVVARGAPATGIVETTQVETARPDEPTVVDPPKVGLVRAASEPAARADAVTDLPAPDSRREAIRAATPAFATPRIPTGPSRRWEWIMLVLGAVWLSGVLAIFVWVKWKWQRFQRTLEAKPDTVGIEAQLQELTLKVPVLRTPRVAVTSLPTVPAVFGFLRPTIVLPEALLKSETNVDLEPILAHELMHLRRGDTLASQVQLIAQAVWWFHPLVWLSNAEARRERERSCDESVISLLQYEPLRYANCLVSIAELARGDRDGWASTGVGAIGSFKLLANRLEHILEHAQKFRRRMPFAYPLLTLLFAAVLLPGGSANILSRTAQATGDATQETAARAVRSFDEADANDDRQLSLEEFLTLPGQRAELERDFRLFDLDRDQALTTDEFSAVPLGRPAAQRGALPDPWQGVVTQAMSRVDEAFAGWDREPDRQVKAQDFVSRFLENFPEPLYLSSTAEIYARQADENQDEVVSREEARRFLEIQHGVRNSAGKLLRLANGQVLRDGTTLLKQGPAQNQGGPDDPIERFRRSDTDLDALLDVEELRNGSPSEFKKLASLTVPAFDLDGDGKLNLQEYRLTPQATLVLPWTNTPLDRSRDDVIQFLEFTGKSAEFPLLWLYGFQRFDRNGNGALEPAEFPYVQQSPDGLYRVNADGTGWQLVYRSEQYCILGAPRVSPDGKWIVCETFEKGGEGDWQEKKILLMTIDGKLVRELGSGILPNWSPDGRKIVLTYPGVQIHDLALNRRRMLVPQGWGGQWSPDGRSIAFTEGADLKLIDVSTEQVTTVLAGANNPYQQIFWNMSWSPDGSRLCIQGRRANGAPEIATVQMTGDLEIKKLWAGNGDVVTNHAWSPDGKRLVFPWRAAGARTITLHELDPENPRELKPFPGIDPEDHSMHSSWSPDGTFLIVRTIHPE